MRVRGKNAVKYEQYEEVSQGAVPFEDGLDTMLDCIELTREMI